MYYEPYVGKAAVAVLEHHGYEVIVPPQNCCGLPLLSNGEFTAARRLTSNNVAGMASYARAGFPIVGTSTSCTLTLQGGGARAARPARRQHAGLTLATLGHLRVAARPGTTRASYAPTSSRSTWCCPTMRRASSARIGWASLRSKSWLIPGLDVRESHARCCGIAGTYGYKTEKYHIAMDVGEELFDFVRDQGDDVR